MKLLENKTALVTGGGIGIGAAIAARFAEAGARVAITYRSHRPEQALAEYVVRHSGSDLVAIELDATDEDAVRDSVEQLGQTLGGIDILVNNVGGLVKRSTIADMDLQLWRSVMAVNLDSTYLITHYALPLLRDGGRIINIASLAGFNGGHPGATAYAASKAAVLGFTRGLAKELAGLGITVNAIAPGFIGETPFHDTFTSAGSRDQTIASIPMGREGTPADVAGAALWLASGLASFVTGTTVSVNGGQYLA